MSNETQTKLDFIENYMDKFFSYLGIDPAYSLENIDDVFHIDVKGDNLNYLIGAKGSGLYSLQNVLGLALFQKYGEWHQLNLDISGYRKKKRDKIYDLVKNYIDRVRFFQKDVPLPNMNSYDRKLVHEIVGEYDDIKSESVGEGDERHVVLSQE